MNQQEALAALRLSQEPTSKEELDRAFQKILRRYPPEHFPERCRILYEAHSYILQVLNPAHSLEDLDHQNLDWLARFAKPASASSKNVALNPFKGSKDLFPYIVQQMGPVIAGELSEFEGDSDPLDFDDIF